MTFCALCQSLPWRDIFRLRETPNTDSYSVQEFMRPEFGTYGSPQSFIKWHERLSQLQANSQQCSFCYMVASRLKTSYHYNNNVEQGADKTLWLLVSGSYQDVYFQIYMGDGEKLDYRISGKFNFSTTIDSPIAKFMDDFVVILDSTHPLVLEQLVSWIETCDSSHDRCACAKDAKVPLPTRLLDLDTLPGRDDLTKVEGDPRRLLRTGRLKLVQNEPGTQGSYMALSYCWGKALAYTTTSRNIQQHMKDGGIKYVDLPQTLRDCIFLVRYLGFRYVWIDCVCIIQDDKADWEREAAQMAAVYTNAYLTIAATRAASCGEGFLQPRVAKEGLLVVEFADGEGKYNLHSTYDDLIISPGSMGAVIDEDIEMRKNGPLLDRVWCFQERMLATRTIHFTIDQMYWECSTHLVTEDGVGNSYNSAIYVLTELASKLEPALTASPAHPQALTTAQRAWSTFVDKYTSRNISYLSDKLPALSGVLSALQRLTGDTCYAGIWQSWFLQGLLWRLQVPALDLFVFTPKQPARPRAWRAPSWSYAAVEGIALYNLLENDPSAAGPRPALCAELLLCSVTPKGQNPLGELESGFARIRAPLVEVVDVAVEQTLEGRECLVTMKGDTLAVGSVFFDVEFYDRCHVLMITPHTGLAVVQHENGRDEYVRVGIVSVYTKWAVPAVSERPTAEDRDRSLSAADYPEVKTIMLL
ncbi:hypothetical protein ACN47E_000662 [Coniothyrium glycines]